MALRKGHVQQFETLKDAFSTGRVALLEAQDAKTGKKIAIIIALNRRGKEIEFVPFARLFNGNPYREVNPPNPNGGFVSQREAWRRS